MALRLTAGMAAFLIVCGGAWGAWRTLPHSTDGMAGNSAEGNANGGFSAGDFSDPMDADADTVPSEEDLPMDGDNAQPSTGDGTSGDDPWKLPGGLPSSDLNSETLSTLGDLWLARYLRLHEGLTVRPSLPLCEAFRAGDRKVTETNDGLRVSVSRAALAERLPEGASPEEYLKGLAVLSAVVTGIPLSADGETDPFPMYELPLSHVTVESADGVLTLTLRPEKGSAASAGACQYLILSFREPSGLRDCLGGWLFKENGQ